MSGRPDLVDDVPLPTDGAARARAAGDRKLRQRRLTSGTAIGVAVVLLVASALVLTRGDRDAAVSTAGTPDTTAGSNPPPAPSAIPLAPAVLDLLPEALTTEASTYPDTKVEDYGPARIAVPNSWEVLGGTQACPTGGAGLLILGADGDLPRCTPERPILRLNLGSTACATLCGDSVQYNWLFLEDLGNRCQGCVMSAGIDGLHLRLDWDYGGDLGAIQGVLSTLTLSPAGRALAEGPVADTSTWQTVTFGGVSLRVPPDWPVADGAEGRGTNGSCATRRDGPLAYTGGGEGVAPCSTFDGGGVWVRTEFGEPRGPAAGNGWQLDDVRLFPGKSAVLLERSGAEPGTRLAVTVWVDGDPTTARTILRSLASV